MNEHINFVNFESATGSPNNEAWHAWRAAGIGASEAVHIAASGGLVKAPSWADANKLLAQKLGLLPPEEVNAAMLRGTYYEEEARRKAEVKLDLVLRPQFGESRHWPWMRASYDGITFSGTIVEIKVPLFEESQVYQAAREGRVVDYYKPQLAQQLTVMWGHPDGWRGDEQSILVVYFPEKDELIDIPVRSEELRDLARTMIQASQVFMDRWRVMSGMHLPEKLAQIEAEHRETLEEFAEADAQLSAATEFLRDAVEGGYTPQRFTVSKRTTTRSSIDTERLLADLGVDEDQAPRRPGFLAVGISKPEVSIHSFEEAEQLKVAAADTVKALKPEVDAIKEQVRELIAPVGRAKGELLRVFYRKGNIDAEALASEHGVDLAAYTESTTFTSVVLRKAKAKKANPKTAGTKAA